MRFIIRRWPKAAPDHREVVGVFQAATLGGGPSGPIIRHAAARRSPTFGALALLQWRRKQKAAAAGGHGLYRQLDGRLIRDHEAAKDVAVSSGSARSAMTSEAKLPRLIVQPTKSLFPVQRRTARRRIAEELGSQ
jgi:hypothetical protein